MLDFSLSSSTLGDITSCLVKSSKAVQDNNVDTSMQILQLLDEFCENPPQRDLQPSLTQTKITTCAELSFLLVDQGQLTEARMKLEEGLTLCTEDSIEELRFFIALLKFNLSLNKSTESSSALNSIQAHKHLSRKYIQETYNLLINMGKFSYASLFSIHLIKNEIGQAQENVNVLLHSTAKMLMTDDSSTIEEAPLLFLQTHLNVICKDVTDEMGNYLWDLANTSFHTTHL